VGPSIYCVKYNTVSTLLVYFCSTFPCQHAMVVCHVAAQQNPLLFPEIEIWCEPAKPAKQTLVIPGKLTFILRYNGCFCM
jgi:hypothetical protein